jgi:hypothetical protein
VKTYCDIHGWEYTLGLQCRECARVTKNDLYRRLGYCQCGTCLPCLAFAEIERLTRENSELHQNDGAMQRRLDELLGNPREIVSLPAPVTQEPK